MTTSTRIFNFLSLVSSRKVWMMILVMLSLSMSGMANLEINGSTTPPWQNTGFDNVIYNQNLMVGYLGGQHNDNNQYTVSGAIFENNNITIAGAGKYAMNNSAMPVGTVFFEMDVQTTSAANNHYVAIIGGQSWISNGTWILGAGSTPMYQINTGFHRVYVIYNTTGYYTYIDNVFRNSVATSTTRLIRFGHSSDTSYGNFTNIRAYNILTGNATVRYNNSPSTINGIIINASDSNNYSVTLYNNVTDAYIETLGTELVGNQSLTFTTQLQDAKINITLYGNSTSSPSISNISISVAQANVNCTGSGNNASTYNPSTNTITLNNQTSTLCNVFYDVNNVSVISYDSATNIYTVNATINVLYSANLTINNTTVSFNNSYNAGTNYLKNQGSLNITNSTITVVKPGYNTFIFNTGTNGQPASNQWSLYIDNSTLRYLGNNTKYVDAASNATAIITEAGYTPKNPTIIKNSVFRDIEYGFIRYRDGGNPSNLLITNTSFYDLSSALGTGNTGAIYIEAFGYNFSYNTIFNTSGTNMIWDEGQSNNTILDNELYNTSGKAIYSKHSNNITIKNNYLHNNGGVAISIYKGWVDYDFEIGDTVENNIIKNYSSSDGNGVVQFQYYTKAVPQGNIFRNNTVSDVNGTGLYILGARYLIIENNIFNNITQNGMYLRASNYRGVDSYPNNMLFMNNSWDVGLNFLSADNTILTLPIMNETVIVDERYNSTSTATPQSSLTFYNSFSPGYINLQKDNSYGVQLFNPAEYHLYYYADINVTTSSGSPISGSIISFTNNINASYPSINRNGDTTTSYITDASGHTPLPIGNDSTTVVLMNMSKNSTTQQNMIYTLYVNDSSFIYQNINTSINSTGYNSPQQLVASITITPNSSWYRPNPNTYQNTTTIQLPAHTNWSILPSTTISVNASSDKNLTASWSGIAQVNFNTTIPEWASQTIHLRHDGKTVDTKVSNATGFVAFTYTGVNQTFNVTNETQYNASGYVNDSLGSPIDAVDVVFGTNTTTTNATGYYVVPTMSNGTWNFSFSKTGYITGYKEITIDGEDVVNQNVTLILPIPSITNVINSSINSTSQYVSWDVNQTTHNRVIYDTGAVVNDSSYCEGTWNATIHACDYAYDGNWSTYAESAGALTSYVFFNYTIPSNANQSESLWDVKDEDAQTNLTIPSSCWNSILYLRAAASDTANSVVWSCYDGSWVSLRSTTTDNRVYEQEMLFKYTSSWDNSTNVPNITLSGLSASTTYNFKAWSYSIIDTLFNTSSDTYVFTTASAGITNQSNITIPANSWGIFNNWSVNTNFSSIATNESNDLAFTFYNVTTGEWEQYTPGYSYNSGYVIDKNFSVLGFFNAETTITATTVTPWDTAITEGWNMLYLMGTANQTLTAICNDMVNCTDIYYYNSTSNDYGNTGTDTIQPNQGFLAYVNQTGVWTRTTI